MKPGFLDDYISSFEHLRHLAGWGANDVGTVMLFKKGLTQGLHRAVLEMLRHSFITTPIRPTGSDHRLTDIPENPEEPGTSAALESTGAFVCHMTMHILHRYVVRMVDRTP